MAEARGCPFCGFVPSRGDYELLLHIEIMHSEGNSPFVASSHTGGVSSDEPGVAAQHGPGNKPGDEDPESKGCRMPDQGADPAMRRRASKSAPAGKERQAGSVAQAWRDIFDGHGKPRAREEKRRVRHRSKRGETETTSRRAPPRDPSPSREPTQREQEGGQHPRSRLGKPELGRFALESQMPDRLARLLEKGGEARSDGVIPVLEQLLEHSRSTQHAYLCDPRVQHVSKMKREGGFCGYRNIQMLISHIIGSRAVRSELFGPTYPSILQIQELIENAWDTGFNSHGRVETGGIRGTRKYIGTPEAQALFCSLGVPCSVAAFRDGDARARDLLLHAIESYFEQGWDKSEQAKVRTTARPPIFLQHSGHSMTIVGLEKRDNDQAQLLVFDPSSRDPHAVLELVGRSHQHRRPAADDILQPYRRGNKYLRRQSEFEILCLVNSPNIRP